MLGNQVTSIESNCAHSETVERPEAVNLFLKNSGFLMKVLLKDLQEQDALDVFQNLYIDIATKGFPDGIDNIRAYLYRAAKHDIIDFKRKSKASHNNLRHYFKSVPSNTTVSKSTDDPAAKLMQFDLVMKAFEMIGENLNPSVNQIFIQKFQHNLNHYEIAEKLGITKSTVDRYLSTGMKQNQDLGKYFFGDLDDTQ